MMRCWRNEKSINPQFLRNFTIFLHIALRILSIQHFQGVHIEKMEKKLFKNTYNPTWLTEISNFFWKNYENCRHSIFKPSVRSRTKVKRKCYRRNPLETPLVLIGQRVWHYGQPQDKICDIFQVLVVTLTSVIRTLIDLT